MGEERPTNDQHTTDQPTDRRVTVKEASVLLGISEDAVRSRLKRGTLRRETAPDGTVFVMLGGTGSGGQPTTGQSTDHADQGYDQSHDRDPRDTLIEVLREQLEQEREANRENRRIIAGLVQRVPEIEASSEPRESPETASETADEGDDEPRSATEGPQEQTSQGERRPWWRRWFGG